MKISRDFSQALYVLNAEIAGSSPRQPRKKKSLDKAVLLWFYRFYPLVKVYITMENHHAING